MMGTGTSHLRDRMVRDAVVDVLRALVGSGDDPAGPALGHVQQVEVHGEHVGVAIVLTAGWRPAAGALVSDVARRLQSVAEIDHFDLTLVWARQGAQTKPATEKGTTMTSEQQQDVIARYVTDVWSKGDLDAIDEIFTADRVRHGPEFEGNTEGAAGHKEIVTLYRTSIPDLTVSIEAQIGEGDLVVTRWRATGTNSGPTMGVPPTGNSSDVWGFFMHRFEGGRIAEEWAAWDTHGLLHLLGVSLP